MSQNPWIIAAALVFVFLLVGFIHETRKYHRRMRGMAVERSGETICQFARSLPYRQLDTAVIRHVYEALEEQVSTPQCHIPIRSSDHITETLMIDPDDLDFLVVEIAESCGRSIEHYEQNPFYPRLHTVEDLVRFLCAQPKLSRH